MNREFTEILHTLERQGSARMERVVDGKTYVRAFRAPERLVLLGAGHVSQAAARFATALDFAVTVADDRPSFANPAAFPQAREILCDDFQTAIRDRLHIGPEDYVCVLTRGHQWDALCMETILSAETMPRYLGMMGSRRRVRGLMEHLTRRGIDPERLARVHAPIGVPIHALTPAEIGVSIAAELIAERRSRPAEEDCLEETGYAPEMLRDLAEPDGPRVLLTVLSTLGSAPAGTGAMMTAGPAGRLYGTVGGGCGEARALTRAHRLLGTGGSEVYTVDMTAEFEDEEGMVCGGTMRLLIEDLPVGQKPVN